MGTELFASEFFRDLAAMGPEPVLKALLPEFVAEEVSHSQCAFDVLDEMVQTDPRLKTEILQAARTFRHVGTYVVPQVSPAKSDNLRILKAFNEQITRLTGTRASDAFFESNASL
jgi:predicted metal-dependent hydrolase